MLQGKLKPGGEGQYAEEMFSIWNSAASKS